jgi:FtsP/CotA-like multicopper oxidase with cupredoxin domain
VRAVGVTRRAAGEQARLLAYEGSFPGPLLVLREGDDVGVALHNGLGEPTSLHLHGLPVAPRRGPAVHRRRAGRPGRAPFRLPAGTAGTYWYHPHVHGRWRGSCGPGCPAGRRPRAARRRARAARAEDRVLVPARARPARRGGCSSNGAIAPRMAARRSLVRLRLPHAEPGGGAAPGARRRAAAPPDRDDGGLLGAPVERAELLLAPGERAEVLVALSGRHGAPAPAALRPGRRRARHRTPRPCSSSPRPSAGRPARLPGRSLRSSGWTPARAARRRRFALGVDDFGRYLINGRPFDHHRVDADVRAGDLELWEVVNEHTTDHPFHLHTFGVQLVERDGRREALAAWRDVVNVRGRSSVVLAVPFRGFTGTTVFTAMSATTRTAG